MVRIVWADFNRRTGSFLLSVEPISSGPGQSPTGGKRCIHNDLMATMAGVIVPRLSYGDQTRVYMALIWSGSRYQDSPEVNWYHAEKDSVCLRWISVGYVFNPVIRGWPPSTSLIWAVHIPGRAPSGLKQEIALYNSGAVFLSCGRCFKETSTWVDTYVKWTGLSSHCYWNRRSNKTGQQDVTA